MKLLNKNWLVLIAALILGGFAVYASKAYISNRIAKAEAALKRNEEVVKVVVAKQDMPRGSRVTAETVAVREIPKKFAHADAVTPDKFATSENQRLAFPLRGGEELLWAHMEGGETPTFSAKLSKGLRAITFPVDDINSISGMVQPGDKIDLMVSIKEKDRSDRDHPDKDKDVVFPLLQDVLVMATGQQVGRQGEEGESQNKRAYTTITLQTSPDNAKRIILAQTAGKLTAVLRNPEDMAMAAANKVDVSMILGTSGPTLGARPNVEIISGGSGARR